MCGAHMHMGVCTCINLNNTQDSVTSSEFCTDFADFKVIRRKLSKCGLAPAKNTRFCVHVKGNEQTKKQHHILEFPPLPNQVC